MRDVAGELADGDPLVRFPVGDDERPGVPERHQIAQALPSAGAGGRESAGALITAAGKQEFPVCEDNVGPRNLLVDDNIRRTTVLDPDMVASVKELGVPQPPVAVLTAEGQRRVEIGHKRTLAAIEAGRNLGVLIAGREGTDRAARLVAG